MEANDQGNETIMPTTATFVDTPYYVLMDGNRRIGPKVVQSHAKIECSPIYGFSDKGSYDEFRRNSQQEQLKPYPLVKVYLREQARAPGDGLKLVVLDAAGPHEPYLHAATVEAVLEAYESRTTHVTVAFRLTFNQETNAYGVDGASV